MGTDHHQRRKELITLSMRRMASLGPGEQLWATQTAIWLDVPRDDAAAILNELGRRGLIERHEDRWRTTAR